MRNNMMSTLAEYRQVGIVNTLRRCQLFAGISSADLNNIATITVVKSLSRDDYLFRQTDVPHGFFVVQSGAINLHRVNSTGREQVIHVFRPGESLGESIVATETGYPADARAVEKSQVLQIQKVGFGALLKRHPDLALKILGAMAIQLRMVISQLDDLTLKNVDTRFASWLIGQCPNPTSKNPVTIQLSTTKRLLAAELGTVSETFSRTVAKFRQQRLISAVGRTFTIFNPSQLNAVLHAELTD